VSAPRAGEQPGRNGDGHDDERQLLATTGTQMRRASFGPGGGIGMPAERSDDFLTTVKRLGDILGRELPVLVVAVTLTVGSVIGLVLGPRLLGQATDLIVSGVRGDGIDLGALHRKLLLVAVLYVAAVALQFAQAYLIAGVVQRSMYRLREDVEAKINRLPLSYVDRQPRGDLLSRVTNDIDNLAQSLQQTTTQILQNLLTVIGVVIMMFVIAPLLAAAALVAVPATLWLIRYIGGKARPKFLAQWRYTGSVNAQAEEVFTGHAVVKTFGRQREAEARFRADNDELYRSSFEAQFTSSLIQPAVTFVGNVQFVVIAVLGGLRISSGAISVGDMQAMLQYVRQFSQPLSHLASMATTFQSGIASLERVLELLDVEELSPEPESSPGSGQPVRGRIVFEHVDFSYDPTRPLIRDLNLVAEPGQTIAIVGPTGAGKTTIVNLLMRFYEIDAGRITLDGRDTAAMSRHELRGNVGMVLQDTWLFGGTIMENLRYGNPTASDAEVIRAAGVAYVDRFVRHLPDGYDTVINDEGDNISVGEKQLMTIARAFLADPSILILDEATSSVDTRTEVLIQEAMNRLRTARTSFVIAHRLSTIRGADVILVMDEGRIVEQGDHDQLLALGGHYADLYRAQFTGHTT